MASLTATQTMRSSSPTLLAVDDHRQSLVSNYSTSILSSSAASFRTAPLDQSRHSLPLSSSSRSSSRHTVNNTREFERDSLDFTTGTTVNQIQQVHILKINAESISLQSESPGKVAKPLLPSTSTTTTADLNGKQSPLSYHSSTPPTITAADRKSGMKHLPQLPFSSNTSSSLSSGVAAQPMLASFSEPIEHFTRYTDEPEPMSPPRERQVSSTSSVSTTVPPRFVRAMTYDARSSLETKTSFATIGAAAVGSSSSHGTSGETASLTTATAATSSTTTTTAATAATSAGIPSTSFKANHSAAHLSTDGYLQPPPSILNRPARRNTTGSSPRRAASHPQPHQHASPPVTIEGLARGELESDIQLHADQIRRERLSKRQKQLLQQEAEAALTRGADGGVSWGADGQEATGKEKEKDATVLVGNLIGEDHVNYVLMYNMLTGIRIGVSRCQAKIKRPLTDEDFSAAHKFSFDIVGNELTPSAKYDFKFKDYAPWVFRALREEHFNLDPADYLLSLTSKYILSELGSPGKSGSFFYFSRDYRFIIKTIRHAEHTFLLRILKKYYAHIRENPQTLLSRFYGLHRVKLPRGKKIHFVIMNNLFPPHRDIHETYDLKGSTVGREYPEEKAAGNPGAVLKDLNWINRGKMLELGPEKRAVLTEQLRRDAAFLKEVNVMDYSLLVGIHNMQRGNRDKVRKNTLKVFSPDIPQQQHYHHHHRSPTYPSQFGGSSVGGGSFNLGGLVTPDTPNLTSSKSAPHPHPHPSSLKPPSAIAMRRAMRSSDPKRLGKNTIRLPEEDTGDRQHLYFYQDEGGLRATDEVNEGMDTIYYLGVIDILTPYGGVKRVEHFWKGLRADRHKISPVPPSEYSDRFFAFMQAIMRGGGGGARFKPDYRPEMGQRQQQEKDKEKEGEQQQQRGQVDEKENGRGDGQAVS